MFMGMRLIPWDKNLIDFGKSEKRTDEVVVKENGNMVDMYLNRRIRWYLREHGISQSKLAKDLGITPSTLCKILSGNSGLTEERLNDILRVLGCAYEELTGKKKVEEPVVGTVVNVAEMYPAAAEEIVEKIEETQVAKNEDFADYMTGPIAVDEGVEEKEEVHKPDPEELYRIVKNQLEAEMESKLKVELEKERKKIVEEVSKATEETYVGSLAPCCKTEPKAHPHQRLIDELIRAAETIKNDAESIVGTENRLGGLTVTIYLDSREVPRINVDKDLYL